MAHEQIVSLAQRWPRLSAAARSHHWERLSPEDQVRFRELLASPESSQPRWSASHRMTLLGVIGFLVLLGALSVESLWRTEEQRKIWEARTRERRELEVAAERQRLLFPQVRLERVTSNADSPTYLRGGGDYVMIKGTVTNAGPGAVAFVRLRCALIHRSTRLESDAELTYAVGAEGLPPRNSRTFEVMLRRPENSSEYLESCRVESWR